MTARTTWSLANVAQPIVAAPAAVTGVTLIAGLGTPPATTTTALTAADAAQDNNNALFVREINRDHVDIAAIRTKLDALITALTLRGVIVAS